MRGTCKIECSLVVPAAYRLIIDSRSFVTYDDKKLTQILFRITYLHRHTKLALIHVVKPQLLIRRKKMADAWSHVNFSHTASSSSFQFLFMRQSCANWTKPKHNQGERKWSQEKGEKKKMHYLASWIFWKCARIKSNTIFAWW